MTRPARLLILALLLLAPACAQQPKPSVTPSGPAGQVAGLPGLQADLQAAFKTPAFENAIWGVLVRSLKTDETLYEQNPRTLLMPASNMKIVTVASAAQRFGWDRTFTTTVLTTGTIENGVLKGDIIVVGTGDPSFGGRPAPDTPVFESWVAQFKAKGINAVDGRIIGDDRAFEDQGLGAGWAWDFLSAGYATPTSALNFDENILQLRVTPGPAAGDFVSVEATPAGHALVIDSQAKTVPKDGPANIDIFRMAGNSTLTITGSLPLGSAPITRSVSVDNPARNFVSVLRHTLSTRGIPVSGDAVDIRSLREAPSLTAAKPLLTYTSPSLAQIGKTTLKVSQNLYADTLLRAMGCTADALPCTTPAGIKAVQQVLQGWGIAPDRFVMVDGSGLSRYNYVTPEVLVTILTRVQGDERLKGPFLEALPVAGVDGTIGSRMRDTKAQGNAKAKTGSITAARALSGFVTTADGEPLVFSMIVNNFTAPQAEADRVIDRAVVRLAEFHRR